jgi:SOS response regulatory protein OraA/RecX
MERSTMEPRTFQEALQAAQRGDRAGAFRLMRQALIENPGYAPAWFWLSRLVDDSARQRECLERALALDPNYAPARDDLESIRLREVLATARSIVAAERTQEPRKIGEYLVEQKVITAAQLKEALAEQNAARNHGQRIPLGDILLRRGWLSPPALASALVKQGQDNLTPQVGLPPERLGEYLVAEKLLTSDQLAAALAEQAQLRQKGKRVALGELLIRNRYLKPEVLARVLEAQRQDFFGRFGH